MVDFMKMDGNTRVNELISLVKKLPGNESKIISREYLFEGVPLWKVGWRMDSFYRVRRFLLRRLYERSSKDGRDYLTRK